MRLFTKIFLCFILVFGAAFQASGYFLLDHAFENDIAREKKYALGQFRYCKYIVQSAMYSYPGLMEDEEALCRVAEELNAKAAFYGEDGEVLYCSLRIETEDTLFQEASSGGISYRIGKDQQKGETGILICGEILQGEERLYLVTETDISETLENHRASVCYFKRLYLAVTGMSLVLILLLAGILTRPINRISQAAGRMAEGNYGEQIRTGGRDEIGLLAENFNRMARTVEEKMEEMSLMVRQKEDFVANFAHEMKTPLTSVIGYADMIYQKDLPRQQVKEAAEYIVREGMRLEALAFKLMDLSVLERQDFALEWVPVSEIAYSVAKGIEPVCSEKNVKLHVQTVAAEVWAEYDLIKTLIMNLLDNSLKADSTEIWLEGIEDEAGYELAVRDNGKGIAPQEIGRVTEAFYMADKSRSRRQHGAGLGLALAEKTAKIHGSSLNIQSDGKSGARVSFRLICRQETGRRPDGKRGDDIR